MIFQVLAILYAGLTILNSLWRRRKGELTFWFSASLVLSHLAIILVILVPNITYPVAHFFGIGRGADFILYTAILILLRITFYLYAQNQRLEHQVTKIVRHLAIEKEYGSSEGP